MLVSGCAGVPITLWYSFSMKDIIDIDPSKVAGGLHKFAGQYVVLDTTNTVVGSGDTYKQALKNVDSKRTDVAVFSIPQADVVLIPHSM